MKSNQFAECFKLAQNMKDEEWMSILYPCRFDGFGLKTFEPISVTRKEIAALIIYQALYISGKDWDMKAVEEIRQASRIKFILVD